MGNGEWVNRLYYLLFPINYYVASGHSRLAHHSLPVQRAALPHAAPRHSKYKSFPPSG
jgi:hypothetical protein